MHCETRRKGVLSRGWRGRRAAAGWVSLARGRGGRGVGAGMGCARDKKASCEGLTQPSGSVGVKMRFVVADMIVSPRGSRRDCLMRHRAQPSLRLLSRVLDLDVLPSTGARTG